YAVLGTLTSIKYPTGAKKNFYYELPYNTAKKSTGYAWGYLGIGGMETSPLEEDFNKIETFATTSAHIQQINNLGIDAITDKLEVTFSNACLNASNPGDNQTIAETQCTGTAIYAPQQFSEWRSKTVDWNVSPGKNLVLALYKIGKCTCTISGAIRYKYPTYIDETKKYGSPRIRKIEDIDANNVSNVYEYAYGKYDHEIFVPDFQMNQKYNFSSFIRRQVKEYSEGKEIGYAFERYYRLHNSSQANTSYGSSD
uniref:hypothetical protein n=1 Tax=Chryseobacterium TaxID=59732 RepID=UPI0016290E53